MQPLDKNQILGTVSADLSVQNYQKPAQIEDVKIVQFKQFTGEDGTFEDMIRLDNAGHLQLFPDFQLKQINRSRVLAGTVKAWHIHMNQEDVWYIPPEDHMILGMWDTRENSATKDIKMRVVMGAGISQWVYVPRGVAHGVVNVNNKIGSIIYLVNQEYNINQPDEYRLPWDKAGADFWEIKKG